MVVLCNVVIGRLFARWGEGFHLYGVCSMQYYNIYIVYIDNIYILC